MDIVPSQLVMWSALVGSFLPVVIAVILRQEWDDGIKSVVAFLCCLVAAGGTAFFAGNLDGVDIVTALLIIFTLAQTTYRGLWRPTGVAPAVESATG